MIYLYEPDLCLKQQLKYRSSWYRYVFWLREEKPFTIWTKLVQNFDIMQQQFLHFCKKPVMIMPPPCESQKCSFFKASKKIISVVDISFTFFNKVF